jgi:nicotinic acetylcholine receptor
MALIQLITLDEKKQIMKTNIWLRLKWEDYQLTWDRDQFAGIHTIRITPNRVWHPDIVLFNNADGRFEVSFKSNILLDENGTLMWIPCSIYKSSCTIDVNYFPFDEQSCEMIYGSWTYNGDEVQLQPYIPNFVKVDLSDYEKSGTWDVVGVPGNFTTAFDIKEGHNVSKAVLTIVMRRKTLFYTVNLILPCALVSVLSMFVFYLPSTAGEKVTMSVSILLALVVFLQVLVTNLLPPSSISLPLFAKYLLFTVLMDVCCILNTIIVLNWNFKTPRTHTMPQWVRTVFLEYLAKMLMMERPGSQQSGQQEQATRQMFQSQLAILRLDLSELHHPECPYSRLSLRHRERLLAAQSSSSQSISMEFNKAIEAVRFIAAHLKNENDFDEVIDDWQYVSLVFDRLLLYIYMIVTVAATLAILMYAPHNFTSFDQEAFKNRTVDERECKVESTDPIVYEHCIRSKALTTVQPYNT